MNEQTTQPTKYTLREYFDQKYVSTRMVGVKAGSVEQYRFMLRRWDEFLAVEHLQRLTIDQIDTKTLADFTAWRLKKGVATATVNKDLRHVRSILSLAVELEDLPKKPRFKMMKMELEAPRAFLFEEIQRILQTSLTLSGRIAGVPTANWWFTLILTLYDTGARIGAVMQVGPQDVDLDRGTILLRAGTQKQRQGQLLVLSSQTVEAIRKIWDPRRPYVWPWPYVKNTLYDHFRDVLRLAGVPTWNTTGSLFHRIRKSTASYTMQAGLDPQWQLGHSAASVTARYLDPRICRQRTAEVIPRPNVLIPLPQQPEHAPGLLDKMKAGFRRLRGATTQ